MPNSSMRPKGMTNPQSEYAKRLHKMARSDAISIDQQRRYAAALNAKASALLSPPPLVLTHEAGRVQVYEGVCPIEGTLVVKGSTTIDGLLLDNLAKLEKRSESSLEFKKFMYDLFGPFFCHGINMTLAEPPSSANDRPSSHAPTDRVHVHWLSLFEDPSQPKLQPFDMVFASKTNLYSIRDGDYAAHSGHALPDVGTLTWDSFPNLASFREVDTGCRRLHLYKSGFVLERTPNVARCRLSLVLSFREPYVPEWTKQLLAHLHAFANPSDLVSLVPASLWSYNEYCFVCFKSFRFFRRRHHCRLCGNAVCSKCSFTTSVAVAKDAHVREHKDVRSCVKCAPKAKVNASTTDARLTASASAVNSMRRSASTTRAAHLKTAASDNALLSRLSVDAPRSQLHKASSVDEDDPFLVMLDEARPRLSHRNSDPTVFLAEARGSPKPLVQVERRSRGMPRSVASHLVNSSPAAYHRRDRVSKSDEFTYNQGFTARSIDPRPPHHTERKRAPRSQDGAPTSSDGVPPPSSHHRRRQSPSVRRGIVSPP
ncbi:hypothetical protein SDRG_08382 [Saprolegnia diclina VS20]|uniref:FYVE-type domain-containing protein n=1 Tax=Saprolegnia diclina (strain VS20) TaxID=1156394 RepID=T0QK81_SAPDV|nr:hypothetical protein SDRG_08382 [Saprolegnia diclina VS20]EQC34175.1 hypothetical protein SDRG_08382 [Saprolegnia diclina VS20]|eukprot:XP_008612487.1 hypothetical protein SDRG_08382 [Saprolegnia diclina VS20]